jgi:hypothetical protein
MTMVKPPDDRTSPTHRAPRRLRWALGGAALVLQIPFLRRGISLMDEGSILAIADGLRNGDSLYVDRITPLSPLTYELTSALFGLFGTDVIVARLYAALIFAGCVVLVHAILCRIVPPRAALIGAIAMLALKPLAFPFWTIVNYSQLAMLFCLASVLVLLRFIESAQRSWLFVAGIGIGLTLVTKQNLGVVLGTVVGAACVFDWFRDPGHAGRSLTARCAILGAGTIVPVLGVLGVFAAHGTVGALLERAVLGLQRLPQPYWVPLPGPELWALTRADLGTLLFTYFPPPLSHLALEGRLDMTSRPLMLAVELAVKAVYYVPLVLLCGPLLLACRRASTHAERIMASQRAAIGLFAALTYGSMLYRADWIHLMNIYPALITSSMVTLAWCNGSRWAHRLVIGIATAWFSGALLLTVVVLTTYRSSIDTPRGRLLGAAGEAADAAAVLDFVAREGATRPMAFLRTEPLYYFLSGQRIPIAFDFLMPGVLDGADDENTARRLAAVDLVIYNPMPVPTVPTPITTYAPLTAHALASDFRIDGVLGPSAIILRRHPDGTRPETTVVDLWNQFDTLQIVPGDGEQPAPRRVGHPGSIERTSWMMYRVISATVDAAGPHTCFTTTHAVRHGDAITFTPMLHPGTWSPALRNPTTGGARFDISIRQGDRSAERIYSIVQTPGPPGTPGRVSLDRYAGGSLEIRFCTALPDQTVSQLERARAGWAELRLVRAGSTEPRRRQ